MVVSMAIFHMSLYPSLSTYPFAFGGHPLAFSHHPKSGTLTIRNPL